MVVRALPVPPQVEVRKTLPRVVRQVLVVGSPSNRTNLALVSAFAATGLSARVLVPEDVQREVRRGDLVLNRVDVRPTLDGPEEGLWEAAFAERLGARLLNRPAALYLAHDKLATAKTLLRSRVAHPATFHVSGAIPPCSLTPPYVLKPRFGSWGADVLLCRDDAALGRALAELADKPWFGKHGALVQELIGSEREDLRVLVACGAVVGAVRRVASEGEWRTNVALGGRRAPALPDPAACRLALRAIGALGLDFAGVDLIRDGTGAWVVLEVNGAVDFTQDYAFNGGPVHEEVVRRLTATYRS